MIDTISMVAVLSTVGVMAIAAWFGFWPIMTKVRRSRIKHRHLSKSGQEIQNHLLATQIPARSLGTEVESYGDDGTTLTLTAPLDRNQNVHGTGFAGSLYSVAVLTAYYLIFDYLQRNDLSHFTLVAKSGSISYKKPVTTRIRATSHLPSPYELKRFQSTLQEFRKATLNATGQIVQDSTVACEYTIELCVFEPRSKTKQT